MQENSLSVSVASVFTTMQVGLCDNARFSISVPAFVSAFGSQSVVRRMAASALFGSLLEMQNLRPSSRLTNSEYVFYQDSHIIQMHIKG